MECIYKTSATFNISSSAIMVSVYEVPVLFSNVIPQSRPIYTILAYITCIVYEYVCFFLSLFIFTLTLQSDKWFGAKQKEWKVKI
jgi:hypothetical protein